MFAKEAAPFYIAIGNLWVLQFLQILTTTFYYLTFWLVILVGMKCYLIVVLFFPND